jgi:hypothetical protein
MKILFLLLCFPLLAIPFQYKGNSPDVTKPDTVKVNSVGTNNKLMIDSIPLSESTSLDNDIVTSPVTGEISQTGENNRVEINTCDTTPKRTKQQVTIKQTGRNNSIKINTR